MSKITKEKLREILTLRHKDNSYKSLADLPHPHKFKDIEKASKRIKEAIDNNENITIVGDYDVDGVVSTAIMVDFFKQINVKVNYIIPNRFDHGYGLSPKIIQMIDSGLVITVDNGISAHEAALICKDKGIDLIITDHHTVPEELPEAYAIVNPKQEECSFPYESICGAQVAWYLCAQLKRELKANVDMGSFLDLLSLAIVADIMPMKSLNYTMVKHGLSLILKSKRSCFRVLNYMMQKSKILSDDIGFFIAPRINSAGRLKDASIALDFLLSDTIQDAQLRLEKLILLNENRKEIQNSTFAHALAQIDEEDNVIVVYDDDWNEGVIGIVASKLAEKFKKPAFVFCSADSCIKGSARAPSNGIDLYALIGKASEILKGFGGHKSAAGLSLDKENLDKFKELMNLFCSSDEIKEGEIDVLGELDLDYADFELISILEEFEPYGLENSRPKFKLLNIEVSRYSFLGKNQDHLKLDIKHNGRNFEAIDFNTEQKSFKKEFADLIVSVNKNEFRGNTKIQFLIEEFL